MKNSISLTRKGNLIVISGPSGSGKGTICRALLREMSDLHLSVSATTRQPRPGEQDGIDYYFLHRKQFEKMIADNQLLEWAEVYGYYYGTPAEPVREAISRGKDVILEIDVQGAAKVKNNYPGCVLIFIIPPSRHELEQRLTGRATDSADEIRRRLAWAEREIKELPKYDYLVINDEVAAAASKVRSIIIAERCRPALLDINDFITRYWLM